MRNTTQGHPCRAQTIYFSTIILPHTAKSPTPPPDLISRFYLQQSEQSTPTSVTGKRSYSSPKHCFTGSRPRSIQPLQQSPLPYRASTFDRGLVACLDTRDLPPQHTTTHNHHVGSASRQAEEHHHQVRAEASHKWCSNTLLASANSGSKSDGASSSSPSNNDDWKASLKIPAKDNRKQTEVSAWELLALNKRSKISSLTPGLSFSLLSLGCHKHKGSRIRKLRAQA